MKNRFIKRLRAFIFTTIILVSTSLIDVRAEEELDNRNTELFTLGEQGETIMVRGNDQVVSDYLTVTGYEPADNSMTSYVVYRANLHRTMKVSTELGETDGYCMQAYMAGPGTDASRDYNYTEGLKDSIIFSALSNEEANAWRSAYVVATRYAFGGSYANPNAPEGRNIHDGGTYGTYLVNTNGTLKPVNGLMIGGKVYQMTPGEARALTQVIVHYVGNEQGEKNITDVKGNINKDSVSQAFKHLKAYADSAKELYYTQGSLINVCKVYDNYEYTKPVQSFDWYIYNIKDSQWIAYDQVDSQITMDYIDREGNIKIQVRYYSKNFCNKLINNQNTDSVTHGYSPFKVEYIKSESDYYDYFTVGSSQNIPMHITYNMPTSHKETIKNTTINSMVYDIDTFSQTADITVAVEELKKVNNQLELNVNTKTGAAPALCYNEETGFCSAKLYSSSNIQDCLFLSSNEDMQTSSSIDVNISLSGSISLNKVSAISDISDNNSCYSLKGALYKVYKVTDKESVDKADLVGSFLVNEQGVGVVTYSKYNSIDVSLDGTDSSKNVLSSLPLGWYMICEEAAPANGSYLLNSEPVYIEITEENCHEITKATHEDVPVCDPIGIEIVKKSSEGVALKQASLEGAEFTVKFYGQEYNSLSELEGVEPDRTWILTTRYTYNDNNSAKCVIHKDFLVEGSDPLFEDKKGNAVVPMGTITIQETKAPEGYELEGGTLELIDLHTGEKKELDGIYFSRVSLENESVKLQAGNYMEVSEVPTRGDLRLTKVDSVTGKPMANVAFSITSKTTGETHIIVTDDEGIASTASSHRLHSKNTNGNDNLLKQQEEAESELIISHTDILPTGIWFSGTEEYTGEHLRDDAGALPYDTYIIAELSSKANENYILSQPVEISITDSHVCIDAGVIENIPVCRISTVAVDESDKDHILQPDTLVTVIDTIYYENLEPGRSYRVEGKIINKATSQVVKEEEVDLISGVTGVIKNEAGENVIDTSVRSQLEFIPDTVNGTVEIPFTFMTTGMEECEIVVYERIYDLATGELIASHEDINSVDQTLYIEAEKPRTAVKSEQKFEVEEADVPKTGDNTPIKTIVILMTVAITGLLTILVIKMRKSNS